MPTYRLKNLKTGKIYEDFMSISDMEKLKDDKNIKLMTPTQMNIVSSVGSIDGKTDNGWKEVMSKVSEAHPSSPLAERYGKRSVKETQTKNVLEKHRNRKSKD
tara:strand:- start:5668 stop:5976 length:309 start_codon:yes stop_codon:yes gene_type:complete